MHRKPFGWRQAALTLSMVVLPAAAAFAQETAEASGSREGVPPGGVERRPEAEIGAERPTGEAEAQRWFERGASAYEAGRFEEALEAFERAYELADVRARVFLLVNLGQVHDRLNHRDEAIRYFERYLEVAPDGPKAEFVRGRLAVLRRERARQVAPLEAAPAKPERSAAWWPWAVAGGLLVVGGVVAAVLLSGGERPVPAEVEPVDHVVEALR